MADLDPDALARVSRRAFLLRTSIAAGALALSPALAACGTTTRSSPSSSPLVPSASSSAQGTSSGASAAGSREARAFGPELDHYIEEQMRAAYLPSLAAAAVHGQELEWAKGYGWADREANVHADADTVYMLGSISKTFIAAAVMKLWEAGSLDLDTDINTYLPFDVRNPTHPKAKITLRMLLTHTSSIRSRFQFWGYIEHPKETGYVPGDSPVPLSQAVMGYLSEGGAYYKADQNFYKAPPGSDYHYSNIGAGTAAYVVEVVSGSPFGDFVNTNLLAPLGMSQSGFHLSDITSTNLAMPYHSTKPPTNQFKPYFQFGYADYPAGTMRTSATHLSIWLRTFMNGGALEGTRILKSTTVDEILRPQIPGNKWHQGLIWYRVTWGGEQLIGHDGDDYGVASHMYFSPKRNVGALTLVNRFIGGRRARRGYQAVLTGLLDKA